MLALYILTNTYVTYTLQRSAAAGAAAVAGAAAASSERRYLLRSIVMPGRAKNNSQIATFTRTQRVRFVGIACPTQNIAIHMYIHFERILHALQGECVMNTRTAGHIESVPSAKICLILK